MYTLSEWKDKRGRPLAADFNSVTDTQISFPNWRLGGNMGVGWVGCNLALHTLHYTDALSAECAHMRGTPRFQETVGS